MGPDGAPKPRTTLLARASSNLLDWTGDCLLSNEKVLKSVVHNTE
jgi:hypothetical protein